MKITRLRISNFLGITELVMDHLGKLTAITGDNGTGKTSILKAVQEAFVSSGVDSDLIRTGSDQAEIMVEIDGNIVTERLITPEKNTAKVMEDGITKKSPATFLATLLGPFNFNPVDFFLTDAKERREYFLSAIPFTLTRQEIESTLEGDEDLIEWDKLDFTKHGLVVLEELQEQIYNKRHLVGQDVTRLQKALEQDRRDIPETFDTETFTDFDFTAKTAELVKANKLISDHGTDNESLLKLRKYAANKQNEIEGKQHDIEVKKLELTTAEDKLTELEAELSDINTEGKALLQTVQSFEEPDITTMEGVITEYTTSQELIVKLKDIARREDDQKQVVVDHELLDELYKLLSTTIPQKILAKMELPVEGISITGNQIKCNDIPIEKLCTQEQIDFCMDIARALSGKLKVICVDRLESLSTANKKKFRTAALDGDDIYQYLTTEVTDGKLKVETEDPQPKKTTRTTKNTRKSSTKKRPGESGQGNIEF